MEFPEKVWMVELKVDGQHAPGYDCFGTEADARNSAIKQAKSFIKDIKNATIHDTEDPEEVENYRGYKIDFERRKMEVYTDFATYSYEWSEFALGETIKETYECKEICV